MANDINHNQNLGNHGFLRGDAHITEGGRFGRALAVSGAISSHLEIPDNPNGSLNLYGDFTLEAWMRPLPQNPGDPVSGIIFRKAAAPEAQSGAGAPDFSYREPL